LAYIPGLHTKEFFSFTQTHPTLEWESALRQINIKVLTPRYQIVDHLVPLLEEAKSENVGVWS
jgi:hypothetical protein